jgi:hypothetical protein
MNTGLVGGKDLYTDSSHHKANADKNKFWNVTVEVTPKAYLKELERHLMYSNSNFTIKQILQ